MSAREGLAAVEELERADAALLARLSRPGPRYTSYPTAPVWNERVGAAELARQLARADDEGAESPLSLYVHLPFCERMCTYCGCNVVVARRRERADHYLDYLAREMDLFCTVLARRRRVMQLHLGGGTPTFLSEQQLLRLWQELTSRFTLAPEAEIALEIDPVVTSLEQLRLLRGLGFNRLSMGVQDFTPEVQAYIGREQSVALTERMYLAARELGFQGINFDLIYGLPKQRPETFAQTLQQVVALRPDRVAVFGYAHVPWMRPHQRAIDERLLPGAPERFQLFTLAMRHLLGAGYLQIGMDHFARPTDELAQARLARRLHRNFQGYTVLPASDLLGLGITAISDVQGCYAQNAKALGRYCRIVGEGGLTTERGWLLSADDRLRRRVILSLMCNYYVDLTAQCEDARTVFAAELAQLGELERCGLLERKDLALELTPLGRVLMRNVAMVFDSFLQPQATSPTFSRTI